MRLAAGDFFFNSWRLVPANLLWGLGAVAVILALIAWPPLAVPLAVVPVLPAAGVLRLAALIARGEPASFSDALDAWHDRPLRTLGLGALMLLAGTILATNAVGGVLSASTLGWAIATLAAWGLVAGWCWLWCFWPILLDPHRPDQRWQDAARLAGLMLLAYPWRLAMLGVTLGIVLLLSALAFLMLFTVSFAFAALAACRYVLPAADRLQDGLAGRAKA